MNQEAAIRRTALAIVGILTLSCAWFYQGGGWNQNTRFAMVRAILEQGTLRIDDTVRFEGRPVTGDLASHDGHSYCDKAPGASFTALLPVAVAATFVDAPSSRRGIALLSYVATLAAAGLPTVLTGLLLFHVALSLGCSRHGAAFASLAWGLGTPAWAYGTVMYGHALAGFCLMAAFTAAVALQRDRDASQDLALSVAVGLAGGWATVSEYPAAVGAAILALLAIANAASRGRTVQAVAGIAVGAFAGACVLGAHNAAAFGSPWTLGYSNEAGSFDGMKQGFHGITYPKPQVLGEILFGRFRGLFYFAPVMVLAPFGLALLLGQAPLRRATLAAIAVIAWFVMLNGSYFYWDGGWSYGPRHLGPALPFAALGLAACWTRAGKAMRVAALALAAWSIATTLTVVSVTAQPPDALKAPWSQLYAPSFAEGKLSRNLQAFVEDFPVRTRDPISHAWNLGERMGLQGRMSLLPLLLAWGAILAAWAAQEWREERRDERRGH